MLARYADRLSTIRHLPITKEDLPRDYTKNKIAFLVGPFIARQP